MYFNKHSFIGFVMRFHSIEKASLTLKKKLFKHRRNRGNVPHASLTVWVRQGKKYWKEAKILEKFHIWYGLSFLDSFFRSVQQRAASDMSNDEKRACGGVVFNCYAFRKLINESLKVLLYSSRKRILY